MNATPILTGFSHGENALAWQLRVAGLLTPVREHRFDAVRRWRFDFAWPSAMVALEVEGGSFVAGRHSRGSGFEGDCAKYNAAAIAGWLVLRVTTGMVDDGRAMQFAADALAARGMTPGGSSPVETAVSTALAARGMVR